MLLEKMETISDTFTVVTDISFEPNPLHLALQSSAMHMFLTSFVLSCICFDVNWVQKQVCCYKAGRNTDVTVYGVRNWSSWWKNGSRTEDMVLQETL
jgi:hypothetical protein